MKMIMPLLKHSQGWGYQYQPAIPRAHCTIPKVMVKVRVRVTKVRVRLETVGITDLRNA